ncbi:hypothetical protein F5Y04DRAFT_184105 [Hypomontagnella monticulosa]|nr:hypothetical protein F5Y04DRAFT_184105 [Hypomontagnella monticulosa]
MSLAPGVEKDGFSFAGDLFAEASGHNRHRRATVSELKDHFKSGSEKDHPAHWFEAQLIHYGLQPSKTKAVARMRLYDAVNQNKLSVPSHIKKLESELKKEWTKKEREAKKTMETSSSTTSKGTKRKAESSDVDLTVTVGGINITVSASTTAKKAKTTTKSETPSNPKATKSTAPKATPKATTSGAGKTTPKPKPQPQSSPVKRESSPAPSYPKKQTARRGGIRQGPGRGGSAAATTFSPEPASRPRTLQTARRARPFSGSSSRVPKHEDSDDDDDDDDGPPPPYSQFSSSDPRSDSTSLQPLGLLNGRYNITSHYVTEQWGHINLDLVLTLSGSQLWGRFDLGVMSGVFLLQQRPYVSSYDRLEFTWRGRELDGPIYYGSSNHGWLRFLGGGRIEGEIDFQGIEFFGERAPGQGMRSEIDVPTMRAEWNGYTQDEYERESRARWF